MIMHNYYLLLYGLLCETSNPSDVVSGTNLSTAENVAYGVMANHIDTTNNPAYHTVLR